MSVEDVRMGTVNAANVRALIARAEAAERERDKAVEAQDWLANDAAEFNVRAEAAEACVVELEDRLSKIVSQATRYKRATDEQEYLMRDLDFIVDIAATEEKRA